MSEKDTIEFKDDGLKKLIKALGAKVPYAKVGVLGDKNARQDHNTNAKIGLKHEFGDDEVPQRSFLRMPITENLQKYLENSGAFDEAAIKEVIKSGSIKVWIQKVGVLGESIVIDAFNSGGFGKWKPSNMNFKKNHQTLVETQQLRNSITSEVEE